VLAARDVAHILSSIRRVRGPFNLRDETSPATIASEKAGNLRETANNSQFEELVSLGMQKASHYRLHPG
jgi:hypothetical protein